MLLKNIQNFLLQPFNKGVMKNDALTNWMANKLPVANYLTASLAGTLLGSIFCIGEAIGGKTRIILGFIGTAWFVFGATPLVAGKKSCDWILGKDTWWNTNFPTLKRVIVFLISLAFWYSMLFKLISVITLT